MENQIIETEKKETNSALHFFLYLLAFLALGFVSFGAGNILFEAANKYFPLEEIPYGYAANYDQGSVKFGIAAIFIAGPIFFYLMYLLKKFLYSGEIKNSSKIRRWLTYIVLFIAAATIIGDLITLVMYFLDGDLATRFLLKVLSVMIIAGLIFWYYLRDIKKTNTEGVIDSAEKSFFLLSATFVLLVFIFGFFLIDSPSLSRDRKIDEAMVDNMRSMSYEIENFYTLTKQLPISKDELVDTKFDLRKYGEKITYQKKSQTEYELCASFKTSNLEQQNRYQQEDSWAHGKGQKCFKRIVKLESSVEPSVVK